MDEERRRRIEEAIRAVRVSGKAPLESAPAIPAAPLAPSPAAHGVDLAQLEARTRAGARWFYWIGGLSLINSIVSLAGSNWSFVIGLGITQVIDAAAGHGDPDGMGIALGLDVLVVGGFVVLGRLAEGGRSWSFVTGLLLYVLDSLIWVLVGDWVPVAFHAFALLCIFNGLQAARQLRALAG